MRHFLFEFITGGGLSDQELPASLLNEGELMLQTLTKELSEISDQTISLTRDSRLALYEKKYEQYPVAEEPDKKLPTLLKKADVSWLIAPETNACLEKYAKLFIKHSELFIGSSPDAIKLASSKYLLNKVLSEKGIKVVETERFNEKYPESLAGWVIKPDDGVGAESTFLITDKNDVQKMSTDENDKKFVVQPYIEGKHMSMSLLVFNNDVQLLACNKQYIDIQGNTIKLEAIGVNECLSFKDDMQMIADKIVHAITGFAGYIGVDLIEKDNELYVLEINPRFTTAYAGLSASLGCNIASIILNTFLNKKLPRVNIDSAKPIIINV